MESVSSDVEGVPAIRQVGMTVPCVFSTVDVHPADEMEWEMRTATINSEGGKAVFEQKGIWVPKSWSMLATNVTASKYFRGVLGSVEREGSIRRLVDRVADTITEKGWYNGYFRTLEDREAFPIARERLDDADWEAVEALAPKADDPVFGTPDPQRFRSLFKHLAEQAQA